MDLKELRKMAGLTQWQTADGSGVSRMKISLAECGQLRLQPEEEAAVRKVLLEAIESRAARIRQVLSGSSVSAHVTA